MMKSLVVFCIPLVLSGMLQQLYNWADAFIVGNVEGETALAANRLHHGRGQFFYNAHDRLCARSFGACGEKFRRG